jgi:DNA-binding HxlR family transcriptional regulator
LGRIASGGAVKRNATLQRFTAQGQWHQRKMLAQTLQWLEADGFVERISYPVVPPHVEYTLTQSGTEIAKSRSAGRLDRVAPARNYRGTNSEK